MTRNASFDTLDCFAPYTPEACERETVATFDAAAPRCKKGHRMTFSMGVGAYRCKHGAIYRTGGRVVCECK